MLLDLVLSMLSYTAREVRETVARTTLLPPLPKRDVARFSKCDVDLLTVDNRKPVGNHYWTKTAAINSLVAQKHNYTYQYVQVPFQNIRPPGASAWCKIESLHKIIQEELALHKASPQRRCKWVVLLDSDAFIRDRGYDALRHLLGAAEDLGGAMLLGLEPQESTPEPAMVFNTGVVFMLVSQWAHRMTSKWLQTPRAWAFCMEWSYEQQCFENMLQVNAQSHLYVPTNDAKRIISAPQRLINSPFGHFVTHVVSGGDEGGTTARNTYIDFELRSTHEVFSQPLAALNRGDLGDDPDLDSAKSNSSDARLWAPVRPTHGWRSQCQLTSTRKT